MRLKDKELVHMKKMNVESFNLDHTKVAAPLSKIRLSGEPAKTPERLISHWGFLWDF